MTELKTARRQAIEEAQAAVEDAAHRRESPEAPQHPPEGQLDSLQAGVEPVYVGLDRGRVMLHFGTPPVWVGMTPAHALEVAVSLMKHARRAGNTTPIVWPAMGPGK